MASVNKVILVGNLGKDPEVRHFEDGGSLATFSIATSDSYIKKDSGEKIVRTEWHNVVTRGGLAAKVVEPYLKKGQSVYIEGRLRTRSSEDKDGNTRYTTEVVCDNLEMLGGKRSEDVANTAVSAKEPELPTPEPGDDLPF
ncbi:MAG: single-stranded DNA-binding protein [Bacteroidetes bacterium]|nr:single-stranded DNA-binding protein [Bacteroidota bacterium]